MDLDSEQIRTTAHRLKALFRRLAEGTSRRMGSPWTFLFSLVLIILWAGSGFYFEFNDKWQLIINTGTTIATFLMVILVQNTQYRDSRSIQLKLDELLFGSKTARDYFLEIEEESEEELDQLKEEFKKARQKYIEGLKKTRNKK